MRLLKTNILLKIFNNYLFDSKLPLNINYFYNYGSLLGLFLVIQILTGIFLAMYYQPNITNAFNSVEYIMREVNYGWLIRYIHANSASLFFLVVYLHIARAFLYQSYMKKFTWNIGIIILLMMIITAFLGYSLVFGSMALWAIGLWLILSSVLLSVININWDKLKSSQRIGPHDNDVLSVIVGCLLSSSDLISKREGTILNIKLFSKHREYILWIHDFFANRNYCNFIFPKLIELKSSKGYNYLQYLHSTYKYKSLNFLYNLFYSNNKKIIPNTMEELLTPLALAIWIQNDGGVYLSGLRIYSYDIKVNDLRYLISIIKKLYNIDAKLQENTLYFPKKSMKILSKLVKPHMIPCMYYKLNGKNY